MIFGPVPILVPRGGRTPSVLRALARLDAFGSVERNYGGGSPAEPVISGPPRKPPDEGTNEDWRRISIVGP